MEAPDLIALRLFLGGARGPERRRFLARFALTQGAALALGIGLYLHFSA